MSFSATGYRVMIASPSDITEERRLVRDVINEWNAVNSGKKGIILIPVGWEDSSAPELGDRPQAILNQQVLRGADVLVAIFWNRIGTPTGQEPSGTVEEIVEHTKANKLTMVYFRTADTSTADTEQLTALKAYMAALPGYYSVFGTPLEFRILFRQHLDKHINEHALFQNARSRHDDAEHRGIGEIFDPTQLSDDAKRLLFQVSEDQNGLLLVSLTHDGFSLTTRDHDFVHTNSPREQAKWRRVIQELLGYGLLEDRGGNGEVFAITDAGYEAEDNMGLISQ
jgi:hypothetical protein